MGRCKMARVLAWLCLALSVSVGESPANRIFSYSFSTVLGLLYMLILFSRILSRHTFTYSFSFFFVLADSGVHVYLFLPYICVIRNGGRLSERQWLSWKKKSKTPFLTRRKEQRLTTLIASLCFYDTLFRSVLNHFVLW